MPREQIIAPTQDQRRGARKSKQDKIAEPGVEQLLLALNSVAQRIQSLWITFISFGAYLTIAVLGTTHRMLFLEEPVKLPLFNIDLPLTSFYLVAPGFLLIFHFYVLVQLVLLARSASAFENALAAIEPTAEFSDAVKMRVDNSIFVQLLAGADPERRGRNAWLIRPVAWLTVMILPALLFLLIELQFLPYHHDAVTWFHRALFIFELVFLLLLWPAYSGGQGLVSLGRLFPGFSSRRLAMQTSCMVGLVLGLVMLAFFHALWLRSPRKQSIRRI